MKNDPNQPTKHHIDPRSRQKHPNKKYHNIVGVCFVPRKMHELYHQLFGNMKPDEIVEYLNKYFWDDLFEIKIKKRGV